jgi:hypothetical protein
VISQEVGEQEGPARQAPGVFVVGQQIGELVAEDRGAARLQDHHRRAGPDVGTEAPQDPPQPPFGGGEKAVVVERPAAPDYL